MSGSDRDETADFDPAGFAPGELMPVLSQALSARIAFGLLSRLMAWRVRGSVRLTHSLARLARGLQALPVAIDGATVFLDLRMTFCTDLVLGVRLEPFERAWMLKLVKPGDMALDVGAYFGLHTVLLAETVGAAGRVYAFEPSPIVLPCLAKTIDRLPNATLFPFALGETLRVASFFVPPNASLGSLADWTHSPPASKRKYDVTVDSLERLLAEGLVSIPDFLKCDVEGAEALVFRGATSILDRERAPLVLFELNPAATTAMGLEACAALSFLRSLRMPAYRFYAIDSESELFPLEPSPSRLMNVLAVPLSRSGSL